LCVYVHHQDDYFLGKSAHVKASMHGRFRDHWANFASQGKISKAEFEATNFPNQYRCMEEYLLPFGGASGAATATDAALVCGKDGGLAGKQAFQGLHVLGANYGETRCPYNLRWINESSKSSDPKVLAAPSAGVGRIQGEGKGATDVEREGGGRAAEIGGCGL
jgi:hypothetical protein